MGGNKYKKVDADEYNEILSNPWSWFYQALYLYESARGLYGLYNLDRIRTGEACKEMIKKSHIKLPDTNLDPDISALNLLKILDEYTVHIPSITAIVPVYMMVMGMAIENIIKGVYVGRKLNELEDGKDTKIIKEITLKKFGINGHIAPKLVDEMNIDLTIDERALLEDATEHLVWSGRYAVPSKAKVPILSNTIMDLTPVELDEILDQLFNLYNRVERIFKSENGEYADDDLITKTCLNR